MPDLDEIAERLRALEAAMSRASARLDAIEQQAPTRLIGAGSSTSGTPEPITLLPAGGADLGSSLSLIGRAFIVFGGAFLLRALTESSKVPARLGVVLGLSYAVLWLIAADRAAGRGRGPSALFHGITGVFVGLPLLWETSTTFGLISAASCATALGLMTVLTLLVADRQRLRTLAVIALGGALSIAVPLAVVMNNFTPFAVLLVALVALTLWVGAHRDWPWLPWPAAIVADAFLFVLTVRVRGPEPPTTPAIAIALNLALLVVTIGYLVGRAMGPARRLTLFEMGQSTIAVALGLGSALWLGAVAGLPQRITGAITLVVAALAYVSVVRVLAPRGRTARTTQFFATMGLVLALAGTRTIVPDGALALTLGCLAVAAAWCGRHYGSGTATIHGLAYAIAALVAAGWTSRVISAWIGTPAAWPLLDVMLAGTLVITWICLFVRPAASRSRLVEFARSGYAVTVIVVSSAALLMMVGPRVAGSPADAGILATLRTVVLTVGVILIAAGARVPSLRAFSLLVYPVLVLGGLKLVVEDFGHSRPATLFIALALYGVALLVAPRLARGADAR